MSLPSILIDIARNPWLSGTSHVILSLTQVGATVVLGATVAKVSNNDRAHAYYASLSKPPGNPPTWALGPIWGTLYGMLGYAAHIIALDTSGEAQRALGLYYVQLSLNFVYMPIFFQVQSREVALADIIAITWLTWKLVDDTRGLSGPAYLLLLPYAIWMLYSTYLNIGMIYLNSKGKTA